MSFNSIRQYKEMSTLTNQIIVIDHITMAHGLCVRRCVWMCSVLTDTPNIMTVFLCNSNRRLSYKRNRFYICCLDFKCLSLKLEAPVRSFQTKITRVNERYRLKVISKSLLYVCWYIHVYQ